MRKAGRRIWAWILSGVALILGVSSCFCFPTPKVYGPPTLYGPPPPTVVSDTLTESDTIVEEVDQ